MKSPEYHQSSSETKQIKTPNKKKASFLSRTLGAALVSTTISSAAACGSDFNSGTIIEKDYHPAYTYTTYFYVPIGKVFIFMPQDHDVPESWSVKIQHCTEEKKKPKCDKKDVGVNKQTFDILEVGQEIDFGK